MTLVHSSITSPLTPGERDRRDQRDQRVLALYDQLTEIERRLIPTGLHVFGVPPEQSGQADMLRMVASFDRPESATHSLLSLIRSRLILETSPADERSSEQRIKEDDRVEEIARVTIDLFLTEGAERAIEWLQTNFGVSSEDSGAVFRLLAKISQQLKNNSELGALIRALRGEYIEPGPGADIVQNPSILPTGRNTHAINPYTVPSVIAFTRAEQTVKDLLARFVQERGHYPNAMALVLWGLDNIKTQGEGVAQALWLLGVRPVRDSLNRATEVEIIPLKELGRPRIDVVLTVSGIFRDLFGATMGLLDKAVRAVAALDESTALNYVHRNVMEQMETDQSNFSDAATRVFSNAPGNYGTNVNFFVMDSSWERSEDLGDLFVTRKCFSYGRGEHNQMVEGRDSRALMDRALARVEATYQNIDSFEIGITDVDHYFEYLGGVSRAVEKRSKTRPSIYLSDTLSVEGKIRSLEETVQLETRTKTLNPKWYEGMLNHGHRGVAEIENHIFNTFGWSATADAVDGWIYAEIAKTFVLDKLMRERLTLANPDSTRSIVGRLLEAHARGLWRAQDEAARELRAILGELEDRLEGVA